MSASATVHQWAPFPMKLLSFYCLCVGCRPERSALSLNTAGASPVLGRSSMTRKKSFGGLLRFLSGRLALIYAVGVFGGFLQIAGGTWDVASHTLGIPDTFFTPSHMVLYVGVAAAGLAGIAGVLLGRTVFRPIPAARPFVAGLQIAFTGSVLQFIAGPTDFWWHDTFGFDPFLFTPGHILLISGIILVGVGMAIGSVRILQASGSGTSAGPLIGPRAALQAVAIVGFAVLWLDLNGLVYLLTDVEGIAYTFNLGPTFVDRFQWIGFTVGPVILALVGTLVLLAVKRVVRRTGAVTSVAVLAAGIVVLGNVAFRASYLADTAEGAAIAAFIPLYVAFLLPVVAFDFAVGDLAARSRVVVGAALVAPFASFLDGWHGTFLWTDGRELLPFFILPMMLAGVAAGALSVRFARVLLNGRRRAFATPL